MRADEECVFFVGRSKTAGATAVELRRRQRQAGDKIGAPVGTAYAIFHFAVVSGKEFIHRCTRGLCSAILSGLSSALWSEQNRNLVPHR